MGDNNFNSPFFIGHSNDKDIRLKSSSGGIGTTLIKYLLSTGNYGTTLTLIFNKQICAFEPHIIHDFSEYNNCGSVYQDINITEFIKDNLGYIRGGMVVTCPPCQVNAIRNILNRNNIRSFIISFSCSGQTSLEGTWCYYRLLGIKKEDVESIQYRGNGWPSGIQIILNNGKKEYKSNWAEPWKTMHSSKLFRPARCFYCKRDSSYDSDVSLADPWLSKYINTETIGKSLILLNTPNGILAFQKLREEGLVDCISSTFEDYSIAQKPNLEKEQRLRAQKKSLKYELKVRNNWVYFKLVTYSLLTMRLHIRLMKLLEKIFS